MHLQARPDRTEEDDIAIRAVLEAVKGGAEAHRQRGTLMNYIALLSAPHDSGTCPSSCSVPANEWPDESRQRGLSFQNNSS